VQGHFEFYSSQAGYNTVGMYYSRYFYGGYAILGYGIAHTRILSELERSQSLREVLYTIAMVGVALLIVDAVKSRAELVRLTRRLVAMGSAFATVGVVQFFTGFDPLQLFKAPGLSLFQVEPRGLASRTLFNRPHGTADHAIEFGVVCAVLLPLALHGAFHSKDRRARHSYWLAVVVLAMGVAMSLSRAGIVAIAVSLAFMGLRWSWRRRINMGIALLGFTAVMWVVIPGLIGTLRGLFTHWGTDPSVQDRIDRRPRVLALWAEHRWFGRGTGTYSPDQYFLLDNQVYETLLEGGIIGIIVTAAFMLGSFVLAWHLAQRLPEPSTSHFAHAVAASLIGLAIATATFDAFFYKIFNGTLFLLVGTVGALWRLTRDDRLPPVTEATAKRSEVERRWN
jgi:hypothetical protein